MFLVFLECFLCKKKKPFKFSISFITVNWRYKSIKKPKKPKWSKFIVNWRKYVKPFFSYCFGKLKLDFIGPKLVFPPLEAKKWSIFFFILIKISCQLTKIRVFKKLCGEIIYELVFLELVPCKTKKRFFFSYPMFIEVEANFR